MWLLDVNVPAIEPEDGEGEATPARRFTVWLKPGNKFVVGRKPTRNGADPNKIVIPQKSISKAHAEFVVGQAALDENGNVPRPTVTVRDLVSKYGSHVNNAQINETTPLAEGDRIELGEPGFEDTVFLTLQWQPLMLAMSGFRKTQKAKVKEDCAELGIECHEGKGIAPGTDMLLVPNLRVTAKVVQALMSVLPLVTEKYVDALREAPTVEFSMPDPKDYCPTEIADDLVSASASAFHPNPERKKLFENKVFVSILQDQYERVRFPVEAGGGQIQLVRAEPGVTAAELVTRIARIPYAVPLDPANGDELGYETEAARTAMAARFARLVGEQEIAHAVVHCSTELFCNPELAYDPLPGQSQASVMASAVQGAGPAASGRPPAGPQASGRQGGAASAGPSNRVEQPQEEAPKAAEIEMLVGMPKKATKTSKKPIKMDDFLDSLMDQVEVQAQSLPQGDSIASQDRSGRNSGGDDSGGAKRRASLEDSGHVTSGSQASRPAKRPKLDAVDSVFGVEEEIAPEQVAPARGPRRLTGGRGYSQAAPAPAPTAGQPRQWSQTVRPQMEVEEAPDAAIDVDEQPEWQDAPESMYKPLQPGDPGYDYLHEEPPDDDDDRVGFEDMEPATGAKGKKTAKVAKPGFTMKPEKVAEMARKAVKARKDARPEDRALLELNEQMGAIKVSIGAKVFETPKPTRVEAPPKKGKGKGKEKEGATDIPNFKRFRKNLQADRNHPVLRETINCVVATRDDEWSDRVWLQEAEDPQLRRRVAGSAPQGMQYRNIEELHREPDEDDEEREQFDDDNASITSRAKSRKGASAYGDDDAHSVSRSTVRSRATKRQRVGSDDEDSLRNDSLLHYNPPKPLRPRGKSAGKGSRLVDPFVIDDSDDEENDESMFRL
ncbi:hypothetical protein DFJ74DRAFT_764280 [Hyaloraphidium curvatum]|nr:hypothetical protein DFJ74DRAFT_764280 [Hyaloraphidium curvatum]